MAHGIEYPVSFGQFGSACVNSQLLVKIGPILAELRTESLVESSYVKEENQLYLAMCHCTLRTKLEIGNSSDEFLNCLVFLRGI